MPLISLKSPIDVPEPKRENLLGALSQAVSEVTGKPERYIMVIFEQADFMFGGERGLAAFVDVRGIGGISPETNSKLSEKICEILQERIAVAPERIYINFTDIPAANWGWNSSTFG